MPRGLKKTNQYADQLGGLYGRIPKAVLAAIAVSYASSGGDRMDLMRQNVLDEWRILYENGIVPQPPPNS